MINFIKYILYPIQILGWIALFIGTVLIYIANLGQFFCDDNSERL